MLRTEETKLKGADNRKWKIFKAKWYDITVNLSVMPVCKPFSEFESNLTVDRLQRSENQWKSAEWVKGTGSLG